IQAKHQGTAFEFTVAPPLNQGSPRQLDVIIAGRPFFVFFWASKKIQKLAAGDMQLPQHNANKTSFVTPPRYIFI
ncbi:MAG TPA: hypothetical protein VLR49_00475, partial [Ferruginibacter sp.]|nr:hypothetical protein [Ferruginibacter sp.]